MPAPNIIPIRHPRPRHGRRRAGEEDKRRTVRFVLWPHPARPEQLEDLRAAAAKYRQLAAKTGRPVTRSLFIQFAENREARAAQIEAPCST